MVAAIFLGGLDVSTGAAQTVGVDSEAGLRAALASASAGATIAFHADITLTVGDLPAIQQDLTIDGQGHTLSGGDTYRGFFVYAGTVTIRDLTIAHASAQGGHGGNGRDVGAGGGGGAGLGGALFVAAGAHVTISGVHLLTNNATGGRGGSDEIFVLNAGGGGGLGGDGGHGDGGGGGIGIGANGGKFDFLAVPMAYTHGEPGIVLGAPGGAHGAIVGAPGGAHGGGGGGGERAGGGGVGGAVPDGGFGGGGGAASVNSDAAGRGGFGGGGGGAYRDSPSGAGGFGGGGGGASRDVSFAQGGFGGGHGATYDPGANMCAPGGGGAGMGGAIFVMEGGTLIVNGPVTIDGNSVAGGATSSDAQPGSAFGSGVFLHGNGVITFTQALGEVQTIADAIADQTGSDGTGADAGAWALVKSGAGTLHLSGDNRFTGGVSADGGVLRIGGFSPIGSGPLSLSGATVQPTTSSALSNPIALGAGGGTIDGSGVSVNLAGPITGAGRLTARDGGLFLALISPNTYAGGTLLRDGVVVAILSDTNLGAAATRLTLDGGTLFLTDAIASSRPITLGALGGTFITDPFTSILDGPIDGPGTLTKRGASRLALYGISTRTGALHVADGRLRVGHASLLWPTAPVTVDAGGGLDIDGIQPIVGSLSGSGTVLLGSGALTTGAADTSAAFNGTISGAGRLTKIGKGKQLLTGLSDYTGGTAIDEGILAIGADGALGHVTGPLTFGGGTLSALASFVTARPIAIGAAGARVDTANGFTIGLAGAIAGSGALRTMGTGVVTLTNGGNSYTGGTIVESGTLRLGASHVIPDAGTLTVTVGATFDLAGQTETVGALDGGGTIQLASALRTSSAASSTFAGTLAGTGELSKSGTGMLTLSGLSPFSGPTIVDAGTLNVTGSIASSGVTVHGGTLAGRGTIGSLTMTGGTLAPGGLSRLTVAGDVTLGAASTFHVTVNGTTPGTDHDQLLVIGGVTLHGALHLDLQIATAADATLIIVDNDGADPIVGTFADLPEGASVTIGDVRFTISYVGGSGNDVVLQAAPAATPLTYELAEGATGDFFDLDLLLANPHDASVPVTIEFLTEAGVTVTETRTLPATSRTTIRVDEIAGLEATALSTLVTSTTGMPLIVERTMRWDATGYGAHTEKAASGTAPTWYFAEGAQGFFSTYFLLVNPHDTAITAHVTYLREGDAALVRDYTLVPRARLTIDASADPELVNRSFGARIDFDRPAVAERAMYFGASPLFSGGHEAAGATALSTDWFLAEGATGAYFTTFVLLANPNDADADATVTYLPAGRTPIVKLYRVPGRQRVTIDIAAEDPSLASAAVGTRVASTQPIVVERAQYWPNPTWYEAHNSLGATETATRWGLAEGRVGGSQRYQTYILLANSEATAAEVTITFLRTTGTTIAKTFTVPPTSRLNVAVAGPGSDVPELADEEFGARIDSTQPIVVERSMYSDANGVTWAAGTNATATRLP